MRLAAVIWLKYCQCGIKHYLINQSTRLAEWLSVQNIPFLFGQGSRKLKFSSFSLQHTLKRIELHSTIGQTQSTVLFKFIEKPQDGGDQFQKCVYIHSVMKIAIAWSKK